MVALTWSLENIYGVSPGEVFWSASDIGWVVGHSYIVYAPLLLGCTTVLYEGKPVGTPDAGAFWRVIEDHGVRTLFTAPTAFRAIKGADPEGIYLDRYDTSSLRAMFLAGERADPATVQWAEDHFHVPVIDHWWQTETGWPVSANCLGLGALPVKYGSATVPVPGWDVRVVDSDGEEVPAGQIGNIVIRLPLPPGCFPTLWQNDAGFESSYLESYPGSYETGDAGYLDEEGYLYIMARTDDIINVRRSPAVYGRHGGGSCRSSRRSGVRRGRDPRCDEGCPNRSASQCSTPVSTAIRKRLRPSSCSASVLRSAAVAAFKQALIVDRLPKTRSGKVLRATMPEDRGRRAVHGAGDDRRSIGSRRDCGGDGGDLSEPPRSNEPSRTNLREDLEAPRSRGARFTWLTAGGVAAGVDVDGVLWAGAEHDRSEWAVRRRHEAGSAEVVGVAVGG